MAEIHIIGNNVQEYCRNVLFRLVENDFSIWRREYDLLLSKKS